MATLMQANQQWATRPADQRFTSLTELHARMTIERARSSARVVSSRKLSCAPVEGDSKALVVIGPNGNAVGVNNWSFGQLAQRAGAPAGYLRTLPAAIAADNINYGLQYGRDIEEVGVLLTQPAGEMAELRAVTGPNYGRIWNADVTQQLIDRFGDGVTGDFRVPGIFGEALTEVTKDNTTLFASDRDMFVFLADEKNRITVPNRRDGKSGDMARGFFVWNSEVGSQTLGIAAFLFDYVCCNRIVWGAQGYKEIKIRHTASANDRWLEEVLPAIENYSNSSSADLIASLAIAKAKKIDDVDTFLAKRFSRSQAVAIKAAHMNDEQRPIETLWDAATGITAYAREVGHQDARVALERQAGQVLDLAIS